MRILLTGATGFIGTAFRRLAAARGHAVGGLVLPSNVDRILRRAEPDDAWFFGTLNNAPWTYIASFKPDVCLHTAWITTPGVYLESPENERFRDDSFAFLKRVQELGVSHIVALGTCIEYHITGQPLSEVTTPIEPTTTYARCKNELRLALEELSVARGFDLCWGRVFYPYGPGEHPSRLCTSLIQKLRRGEEVVLKTPGSTKDYIYIDDLASAILHTIECRFRGTINWGTGVGVPVREIARVISAKLGKEHLVRESVAADSDPLDFVVADPSRLQGMGWVPKTTLADGIRKLIKVVERQAG